MIIRTSRQLVLSQPFEIIAEEWSKSKKKAGSSPGLKFRIILSIASPAFA